jgi:hypothetical protein
VQTVRVEQAQSPVVVFVLDGRQQLLFQVLRRVAGVDGDVGSAGAERFKVLRFSLGRTTKSHLEKLASPSPVLSLLVEEPLNPGD